MNARPASTPTTTAPEPNSADNTLPIVAGGALALLALGGAAVAVTRRRRSHEEEWTDNEAIYDEPAKAIVVEEASHEPVVHEEQPRILAPEPSAFAWGNSQPASASASPDRDPDDDRMPGETWVQRAYRGPSANNPSVSLRNRLRRAAFFDKRERDVAAGVAEPVEMDAGLPDAMVDEREREFA
jgi:MYXO-CTERM domain-containing protein